MIVFLLASFVIDRLIDEFIWTNLIVHRSSKILLFFETNLIGLFDFKKPFRLFKSLVSSIQKNPFGHLKWEKILFRTLNYILSSLAILANAILNRYAIKFLVSDSYLICESRNTWSLQIDRNEEIKEISETLL